MESLSKTAVSHIYSSVKYSNSCVTMISVIGLAHGKSEIPVSL